MLRKVAKHSREREGRKKKEVWFAGSDNPITHSFSETQMRVIKKYHDFVRAVSLELKDYAEFH